MDYCGEHAIVIGSGIAGIVVAKVLANYFQKVTIIEKDSRLESESSQFRSGVPQGSQTHTLLPTGADILRRFFPNFHETVLRNGARYFDYAYDVRYYISGWMPRVKSGRMSYCQSRPLLENTLRSLLAECSNVTFLYSTQALGLLNDFKDKRITGVHVMNVDTKEDNNLYADLTVDASGRFTNAPTWLEALGYDKPALTKVNIDINYVNRLYRFPKDYHPDYTFLIVKELPPIKRRRGAGILALEDDENGNRWMITLVGQFEDVPPTTEEGFLEFAQTLQPEVYEAIKIGKPITPFAPYKFPAVWRYHYEKISHPPLGFLACGDAICAFSPLYGLGMTAGARMSVVLNDLLSTDRKNYLKNIQKYYYKEVTKFIDAAWDFNVRPEFFFAKVPVKTSFSTSFMNSYHTRVTKLAHKDPALWRTLLSMVYLEHTSWILFRPGIFFRIIWQMMRGK